MHRFYMKVAMFGYLALGYKHLPKTQQMEGDLTWGDKHTIQYPEDIM